MGTDKPYLWLEFNFLKMFVCFPIETPSKKQKSARTLALPYNVKQIPEMYAHKKSVAAGAPWRACQHSDRMLTSPSKHKNKPKCVLLLLPKILSKNMRHNFLIIGENN